MSESRGRVLLLEPNYQNKYPPIGLMKFATYHRRQGWEVVFYKGDLQQFIAARLTLRYIQKMNGVAPDVRWGKWYPAFLQYIGSGKDTLLSGITGAFSTNFLKALSLLEEHRAMFRNGGYFKLREFDRVLVTTLFTFFAKETIEAIKFAKKLAPKEIQIGGVMASVVPDYIREQTGVEPTIGVLDRPYIFKDPPIDTCIDDLPLDYSILEEIDYKYPASNAYFGHTTRGCPNKCQFCVVPILEPEYQSYRSLKAKIEYETRMFGSKPNLLLLDNNVFASKCYDKIVDEIKSVGFRAGAKIEETDPLDICRSRIREGYNVPSFLRQGVKLLQDMLVSKRLTPDDRDVVEKALLKYNAELDWHGTTAREFLSLCDEILPQWSRHWRPSRKAVVVDFNQGLDSRLSVKPAVMAKLAEIPVKPVRIAFDHWELRKVYEKSITGAARAGFKQMSNYILYNFKDRPEELYWRLRLNVALSEELDISIYSFPMKYHPIQDPAYFSNRHYLGQHWCRKYIRFVQVALNATMGKVGKGKPFFLKSFGETTEEFRELLLMPEYILLNRLDCELNGEIERWRDTFRSLNAEERSIVRNRLISNEIGDPSLWVQDPKRVREFMGFYLRRTADVRKVSESARNQLVQNFSEKWHGRSVRLTESDIAEELGAAERWLFRVTTDDGDS